MPPASSISCGVQWPAVKTGSNHSIAATIGRSAPFTATRTRSMRARWRATRSSAASRAPVAAATVRMSPIVSPIVFGSSAITFGHEAIISASLTTSS